MTRVLVAIDVPDAQATDAGDLLASVAARLSGEAGYLHDGTPVTPSEVVVAVVDDDTPLYPRTLAGIYNVGVEGVA